MTKPPIFSRMNSNFIWLPSAPSTNRMTVSGGSPSMFLPSTDTSLSPGLALGKRRVDQKKRVCARQHECPGGVLWRIRVCRRSAPGARICKKSALGVLLMEDGRSQRMPCPLTHDLCTVTATDAESSVGGFALTSQQAGRREAATKRRTCPARTKIYNAVPATAPSLYGGTWYRGHLLLAHS